MKNKFKNIVYAGTSLALLAPALVGAAQFEPPTGLGLPDQSIYNIIQGILNWLLMAVGIIAVIGFLISGILYITAAGNDKQIEKAKSSLLYSVIGIVVALAGLVAIRFAVGLLNGTSQF